MKLVAKDLLIIPDDKIVLNNVSVSITSGEILIIIGPSGSGKSSLLRTLACLDKPKNGSVFILDDHDEKHLSVSWPTVTLVFQQLFLWPHLTVRENIRVANRLDDYLLASLLQDLGIAKIEDRFPNTLSLGQKQRVAIARGISCGPAFLLLDEITSALDVEWCASLVNILTELASSNKGIAIVTHQLGFARRIANAYPCTKLAFIDQGCLSTYNAKDAFASSPTERIHQFFSLS